MTGSVTKLGLAGTGRLRTCTPSVTVIWSPYRAASAAREFGATDIVEERGDEGVAKIKELTGGLGAHSVLEAVGTQESMMQATRAGGHVGFVGVAHDVALPGLEMFFSRVHLHGGPAPVRDYLPELIDLILQGV
ncbi:threonine dehydrogenase-like Zn-dependent dehydrogenase [Arthrobacter sp. UYNi723]